MQLTCLLACLLTLHTPTVSSLYLTGMYTSSGSEIEAPILVSANQTWQIAIHLHVEQGAMLVPLFHNRTTVQPGYTPCSGYVTLSCLFQLNNAYLNDELDAFLHYLASDINALNDLPASTSFVQHAFPTYLTKFPRAWCLTATSCILEISDVQLKEQWLTREIGVSSELYNVVDREMEVTVALIKFLPSSVIQVTLVRHVIVFHDPISSAKLPSNVRHHAFHIRCSAQTKPTNALWRADIEEDCLWFCMPGTIMYPSATDYFHMRIEATHNHTCTPEPSNVIVIQFEISFDIPSMAQVEYAHANALLALQRDITETTSVVPQESLFYLQSYSSVTLQPQFNVFAVYDRLYVSVALFLRICDKLHNFSGTEQFLTESIQDANAHLKAAEGYMYSDVQVLSFETFSRCFRQGTKQSWWIYVLMGVWGFILCSLFVIMIEQLCHRNDVRYSRVLRRMGPLVR